MKRNSAGHRNLWIVRGRAGAAVRGRRSAEGRNHSRQERGGDRRHAPPTGSSTAMVVTGTMEVKGIGLKGSMTSYHAAPDKMLVEITIQGVGTILDGSDGEVAWEISALQGPRLKEGDEKAVALREGAIQCLAALARAL